MSVDPNRAKSLFLAASDLSEQAARAAYLDRECGDDADLRARVEALLRADDAAPLPEAGGDDSTGAFGHDAPETATVSATADGPTTSDSGPAEHAGALIAGKYTLVEVIGEGGMGSVWRAKQTEPVKRFVAIKLIKAGMDSRQVLARFEAERQALALMDHPNIAKVFDGGLYEHRPYFVMELVKGVPITEYCDARKLTPKERLELFVPVCHAIQHAHQKGIIHRDIKPRNVLVALYDDKPVVKVIDFGVAKATGGTLTERTIDTAFGAIVGTPLYMSPEQATFNNPDIDTRSDVYALGVLLYELLTGSPPFSKVDLETKGLLEMLRVVREEEPPRPSTKLSTADALPTLSANRGTEPKKLTGLLRKELDWIVMKAIEKDRTRRYETANGVAADVLRYLCGEAVLAHPPSTAYRLKKFARRNKGQVITASLVFFALLAGVIGTGVGLIRAKRAAEAERLATIDADEKREKAEKAYDRTADVLDTMVSEVTGNSLATQKAITAEQKKFLTEVLKYYREFAGVNADDEKTRLRSAHAAFRVGLIEYRLGRMEESAEAYRRSGDGYAALAAEFPAVPMYRQELAQSHNNLGNALSKLRKQPEAEEQFHKALAIDDTLAAKFPAVPAYRQELAHDHNNLGNLLADLGKRPEAEQQYGKALAIQEKLAAEFPAVPAYRQELAHSHGNLGILLSKLRKQPEAEEQYRQAFAIQEKLAVESPAVPEYRQELAWTLNNLGILLADLGKQPEAEEHFRKVLAIQEKLAAEFPAVPEYRQELAHSHNNLGNPLVGLGKRPEAEEHFRKALAIQEPLATEFPAVPSYRQELAHSHDNLGGLLASLGKRPEAEEQYHQALAIREKLAAESPAVPAYRQELAGTLNNLGALLADLDKRPEAEEQYRQALAILEKLAADLPTVPAYRQELAGTLNNLGFLLADLGKRPEAEEQYRQALAILEKLAADFPTVPAYRQKSARSHNGLGLLLADLGKRPEAEEQYHQALAIREKLAAEFPAVPEYRKELAWTLNNLGALLADLGKRPEAEEQYRQALAILEKLAADFPTVPAYHQDLARNHNGLGLVLEDLWKGAEAEEQYRQALAIRKKLAADFPTVPAYRQDLARSHNNLGILLASLGNRPEAEEHYHQALAIREKLAAEFPAVPSYRQELARSHNNLGFLLSELRKRPEAEEHFRKALAIKGKLAADFPTVTEYRLELARSHDNLGLLLKDLGKRPEAEEQYRQALAIRKKLAADFPTVPAYRLELAGSLNNLGFLLASLGKRPEAEEQYRQALAIRKKLATDFPTVPAYRVDLGGSYCNFGMLVRDGGKPAESLAWFQEAIDTLGPVHEKEPRDVRARQFLRNSYVSRARAYDRLAKYADAVKDWSRAVELSEKAEQPEMRAGRATSKLWAGQVAEAVAEVAELTKSSNWKAGQWYDFACFYAVASAKVVEKKDEYAKRGVELLQQAVKAGYKDTAHMKKDTDLDPLRGREEFKKLMAELEKPAEPKK